MQSYISILREVRDPRDINARHPVETILFLTLAATLCGAKSCVEVAEFTEGRESELCEIVDLPYGAPSHDTFSRLFRLLDPAELAKAFTAFMTALRAELGLGPTQGVVAIDGKSLRRGYEKGRSHMPPLMVSVWDSQTRVAIAQARAPGGNEIAATLKLLGSLVLKACTVTADALHCHPAMAQAVLDAKADYALGLKANHGPLYAEAERAFAKAGADAPSFATEEKVAAAAARSVRVYGARPYRLLADRGTCAVAGSQGAGSYRSGTHRNERRERDRHPLCRALAPTRPGQNGRSRACPLGHREPVELGSRCRIRRGRRSHAQGLRTGKPRRHPPSCPEHLANAPFR